MISKFLSPTTPLPQTLDFSAPAPPALVSLRHPRWKILESALLICAPKPVPSPNTVAVTIRRVRPRVGQATGQEDSWPLPRNEGGRDRDTFPPSLEGEQKTAERELSPCLLIAKKLREKPGHLREAARHAKGTGSDATVGPMAIALTPNTKQDKTAWCGCG